MDSFKGASPSIKSWIFSIASNHTKNILARKKRWTVSAQDVCRDSLVSSSTDQKSLANTIAASESNQFDVVEHIDFCFTCLGKTLPYQQQVALVLKDVYQFKVDEIGEIMEKTPGVVKHLLHTARRRMRELFRNRCSLVNKLGACYQCDELNDLFPGSSSRIQNPFSHSTNSDQHLESRTNLIQGINPLRVSGTDLHHHLMEHLKKVNQLD